jgi:Tol biopolymer transport system component
MSSIKPEIDPNLDAIVLDCLEKDPRERTQSMAQVALELKKYKRDTSRQRASRITAARAISKSAEEPRLLGSSGRERRSPVVWIVASLCFFIAAVTFGTLYFTRPSQEVETIKSSILAPEKLSFATQSGGIAGNYLALSSDGSILAFVAADSLGKTHLMVRALDALNAKELPATEGATYPFWSPDNRYVGFFQSGKLKKIEAAGGPSLTICDAVDGRGGSWNQGGVIIFSNSADPIHQVPATGGAAAAVTKLDTSRYEKTHRWPHFLPDGKHFLYFSRTTTGGVEREEDALFVASLDGKVNKRLMHAKGNVVYASGYLIYLREKTLMAQPFDLGKLETSGDAVPIAEPVEYNAGFNRAIFSVSQNGMLIYQASTGAQGGFQFEWFDRAGKSLGRVAEPLACNSVSLSPDGKKIAFDLVDSQSENMDIWIYDIGRGLKNRFTFDPSLDQYAVWSPDGSRIIFCSNRRGRFDLYQKTSSGAGVEELVFESSEDKFPMDWSSDGRFVAYAELKGGRENLWILPVEEERKPLVFPQAAFDEDVPQFSPDGRWMAYASNESGNWELYVCPFIDADGRPATNQTGKWQVSTNGVASGPPPRWNPNGKELFYLSSGNRLMTAEVKTSGLTFDVGTIRPLFELNAKGYVLFAGVSADGQKFLIGIQAGAQSVPPLTLVTHWDEGLKKK